MLHFFKIKLLKVEILRYTAFESFEDFEKRGVKFNMV